jgi:hypothetical protein
MMIHRYIILADDILTLDTAAERAEARRLMACEPVITEAPVYVGPAGEEGQPTGEIFVLETDEEPEECEDNACTGCAWCDREVGQ